MSFLKLLAHYSTSPVGCWCAFLWTLFVLIRQLLAPHLIARDTQRIWKKKRRKQKGLHKGGGETGKKINARRDTRKKSWNHILYTCFITLSFYVLYPHLVVFLAWTQNITNSVLFSSGLSVFRLLHNTFQQSLPYSNQRVRRPPSAEVSRSVLPFLSLNKYQSSTE